MIDNLNKKPKKVKLSSQDNEVVACSTYRNNEAACSTYRSGKS